jgi:hypothetical protein
MSRPATHHGSDYKRYKNGCDNKTERSAQETSQVPQAAMDYKDRKKTYSADRVRKSEPASLPLDQKRRAGHYHHN